MPFHYSLMLRWLFNNMGSSWPQMLSVKWSSRPFLASLPTNVGVSEWFACSAASFLPWETSSMPPFHLVRPFKKPFRRTLMMVFPCKKLQCTSLFKWCIVLGFSEPKRFCRLCKVPLVTADAWYYYLAIRSSCRFRSLGMKHWDVSYTCQN